MKARHVNPYDLSSIAEDNIRRNASREGYPPIPHNRTIQLNDAQFGIGEAMTKYCSVCGKKMIKVFTGVEAATLPPDRLWRWRCACGNTEAGGWERDFEDVRLLVWKRENNL